MENMDTGLTVPQMPQNLSAQIVCPSPKVWNFDEKGFIVRPYFVLVLISLRLLLILRVKLP